jgi:hypothetical protein
MAASPHQRNEAMDMCTHEPRCPDARTAQRTAAHISAPHPEQGWNLLCNGVILFDDGGVLLPTGEALDPQVARPARLPLAHAA